MAGANPATGAPAIAMVATSSGKLPNAASLVAASGAQSTTQGGFFRSMFGRKSDLPAEHAWEDSNLIFPLRDAQVAVSLMPAPIPWSELEGPCATAWWWPDATERMQSHTNHFIVAVLGGAIEPIERRLLLTKLVGAVIKGSDALGVYWGEGTLVHEPSEFLQQASTASAQRIPGTLWLDVRVEENTDGSFRCFTTGLAPLGFLEIEVDKSTLAPQVLMEFIGDTACYIVNSRLHIPDSDTMGRTATEKYKVRHEASMFDRAKVMKLLMQ